MKTFYMRHKPNKSINTNNINTNNINTNIYKKIYSIIPLNIFQTYNTLDLPPKMKKNIEILKNHNPEFIHYLYDDNMCRQFISENFDKDVLYTFDKLKSGAYKADLWRYCILYIKGGIYLDIKFSCINNFKLIELTDKEYWVKDLSCVNIQGIYNDLLVCMPNNKILYNCIREIVENVKNDYYGYSSLSITGPHLVLKFFNNNIHELELSLNIDLSIYRLDKPILCIYREYRDENNKYKKNEIYDKLYKKKDIYLYPSIKSKNRIEFTRKKTKNIMNENYLFYSGTPHIIELPDNKYLINIRYVDYNISNKNVSINNYKTLNSRFIVNENIKKISDEIFLEEDFEKQKNYVFMGLEDIRIFNFKDNFYYIATNYDNTRNLGLMSSGLYIMDDNKYVLDRNIILPKMYDTDIIKKWEKNWSFVNYKDKLCIVYNWFPLQIGEINYILSTMDIIEIKYNIPEFFKDSRGSTPGYIYNNEIWFILHKALYGNNIKNYQHFFAVFDLDMNLLRYSELFKFENNDIEFCTSLIVKQTEIILGYSLFDNQSIIAIYDINNINNDIKWYLYI